MPAANALTWSRPDQQQDHQRQQVDQPEQVISALEQFSEPATPQDPAVVQPAAVQRDSHFMAAAWDEDDARMDGSTVERAQAISESGTDYEALFADDDTLQNSGDDLFEDDIELPEPDDELEQAEQAIDDEFERRESEEELDEFSEDSIEEELFGDESEMESGKSDPFDVDEDWLNDAIEDTDDQLQEKEQKIKSPNFGSRPSDRNTQEDTQKSPYLQKQLDRERAQNEKNCEEEIAKIRKDRIRDINLDIRLQGNPGEDFPYECVLDEGRHTPRQWSELTYTWKASALCHKPLYFEQVRLERYGHSWGERFAQPVMSGVHFFGTLPVLPYKMGVDVPNECIYALGYYRPGNCAPYMVDPVPLSLRGALFQAGAVTGTAAAIP